MATITTRELGASPKGSPLTNAEVDNNFININTELGQKLPLVGGSLTGTLYTVSLQNSGGITLGGMTATTGLRLNWVNAGYIALYSSSGQDLKFEGTGGGPLAVNLVTTGAAKVGSVVSQNLLGADNTAGTGYTVYLKSGTGTGISGSTGGAGTIKVLGSGVSTDYWSDYTDKQRRGGVLIQGGITQADSAKTYYHGSHVNIKAGNGTNDLASNAGMGGTVYLEAGIASHSNGSSGTPASLRLGGGVAASNGGGAGNYSVSTGTYTNSASEVYYGCTFSITGGSTYSGGRIFLEAGTYDGSFIGATGSGGAGNLALESGSSESSGSVAIGNGGYYATNGYYTIGSAIIIEAATNNTTGDIRLNLGNPEWWPGASNGKAYITRGSTSSEILDLGNYSSYVVPKTGGSFTGDISTNANISSSTLSVATSATIAGNTILHTGNSTKVLVVATLPDTPDPNTLYVVTG